MAESVLKVGLFTPYDLASHGGVNDHVVNLHQSFQSMGLESHLVGPYSGDNNSKDESVTFVGRTVPIPTKGSIARVSLSLWQNPRVKQIIKQRKFDVIHVHEPFSSVVTMSALGTQVPESVVKIATFHTFQGSNLYRLVSSKLLNKYASELDGRIAVSEPARDFISTYIPGNYEIIPNAVNVQDFKNAEPMMNLKDKVNLLYVGRLERRKGLIHLLRAYRKLTLHQDNLRLIVVGGGSLGKNERRFLENNSSMDVLFTGEISDYEKFNYFKSADIFCSPSVGQESFGIVLLEAMASGVAVVASNIAGYASVIRDNENGLLFDVENSDSLYEALTELLSNKELKDRLTKSASLFVKDFDWSEISQKILSFYCDMASNKNLPMKHAFRSISIPLS